MLNDQNKRRQNMSELGACVRIINVRTSFCQLQLQPLNRPCITCDSIAMQLEPNARHCTRTQCIAFSDCSSQIPV